MKFNMKTGLMVTVAFALVLSGFLLVGSNQRADADVSESGISLKLSFSEIMMLFKTYMGTEKEVEEPSLGGVTNYDSLTLGDDLIVGGETAIQGFTQGGGVLATTTTLEATATLTEAQLLANNIINYSDGGVVAPALTVTLPATSTMTTLMPNAGDRRMWVLENDFTGAATTTTIAAGTGIDLQEPGTGDVLNVIINPAGKAYIDCYRRADTDVVCLVMESSVAD